MSPERFRRKDHLIIRPFEYKAYGFYVEQIVKKQQFFIQLLPYGASFAPSITPFNLPRKVPLPLPQKKPAKKIQPSSVPLIRQLP